MGMPNSFRIVPICVPCISLESFTRPTRNRDESDVAGLPFSGGV